MAGAMSARQMRLREGVLFPSASSPERCPACWQACRSIKMLMRMSASRSERSPVKPGPCAPALSALCPFRLRLLSVSHCYQPEGRRDPPKAAAPATAFGTIVPRVSGGGEDRPLTPVQICLRFPLHPTRYNHCSKKRAVSLIS